MAEIGILSAPCMETRCWLPRAEAILTAQGHQATVFEDPQLSDWQPYLDKVVLVVTSTTGARAISRTALLPLFRE